MAFEEIKENTENIQDQLQSYFESNFAYYKLKGFKLVTKSITAIIKLTLFLFCFFMVLLFCSIALAFAIGNYFNSDPYGFAIVGGVYLFFIVLLFFLKDKIIERPVLQKFSEIFFND